MIPDSALTSPAPMLDTIEPWRIPATYNGAVAAYHDGHYAWSPAQEDRFDHVMRISVTGDPAAAAVCRALDVEKFDASPAQAPGFVDARLALGRHDATIYSSRDQLAQLFRWLGPRPRRHWIATLDNHRWTPAELAANIDQHWGVQIDPAMIWAIQCYHDNPAGGIFWDRSLVYGAQDFWDPAT